MRAMLFVTFALLAGCASSLEQVKIVRAQAPDWYEARKVEFKGVDYPTLDGVPVLSDDFNPTRRLAMSEAETIAALEMFNSDPRAEAAEETPADIQAWAEAEIRAIKGQVPAPDFLTDADVAALKARFDVPRGRL